MSAVLPATPPPAEPAPRAGFFTHHGIWAPGVRLFRALGFSAKAVTISLAFMLPMLGLLGWLLKTYSDDALAARMEATRHQVALAHGLVAFAHAQQASGQLGAAQAQQLARQLLLQTRPGEGPTAFWLVAAEAAATDATAPDRTALEQALQGGHRGFVRRTPQPGTAEVLSYAQRFEPWGWILGATVPTDDLGPALQRRLALVGGILLLAQGVAGYLFLSFYRVMDGGLRETRRHLRAMAAGDLTTAPRGWGQDETAQVMQELARMQEALRSMVQRVRVSSDQIVDASAQIAAGATDLSSRSELAAASLKQSAASMEQVAATVQGGAELAEEASRTARHNAGIAADGGRVMQEVVTTMEGIRGASSRIAEIVGTIDGIAFQTHILALNAAVEAAHAGAQGRGFAVVANEVRLLARRSADAAKEIKALIGGSVEQVQAGTLVVRKAGSAMHDIVAASQRVSEMLGDVAAGARTQSQGIGRIGQQVVQLDRVTQENSALVGRTAGAAAEMRALADTLADEVARFRLPAG